MSIEAIKGKLKELEGLIGNTPLLEIKFKYKGQERRIFGKAEYYNYTGSIKDRMALHILKAAYTNGDIRPGDHIVEATSGNTGISFAALGSALCNKVSIYMPNWMSDERKNLIKSFGARIELVSPEQGGFLGSIKMTEDFAKDNEDVFLPRQFSNHYNIDAHYRTTGPEIWRQLEKVNLRPDAVVAGVGTGGTIMGIGKYLREMDSTIKVHPLEPANSPTLRTGYKVGKHRIQGISDEFIPEILKLDKLDEIISVDDGDAIIMAQKLSTKLGLGVGISTGANFLGAIMVHEILGPDSIVVTVFPDDNKKYLSTDLMKTEPVKEDFISPEVELIDFKTH